MFAVLSTAGLLANPIFVSNVSFETLPTGGFSSCGAGCFFDLAAIPGWTNTGASGQFQPGTGNTTRFNTFPDGPTDAFTGGGDITQTLAATVQVGVTYTLQVDVGWRKDTDGTDASLPGAAFLVVNGIPHSGTFLGGAPVVGAWNTETIVFTAGPTATGPIMIDLSRISGVQANFDNVRLSDNLTPGTAIPEPTYTGVLAACFAVLAAFARRSSKRA